MNHIDVAIKIAKYSNVKKAKVSAIAFSHSGRIIAMANNRRFNKHSEKFTQHAEEVLLYKLHKLKAFSRFKNITILIIRITKHGISMAKPCIKCQKLLERYSVNILYSGWDKQIHVF